MWKQNNGDPAKLVRLIASGRMQLQIASGIPTNSKVFGLLLLHRFLAERYLAWLLQSLAVVTLLVEECMPVDAFFMLCMQGGEVEYVTEEKLAHLTVHDVMLPLPGYDILFPRNDGILFHFY